MRRWPYELHDPVETGKGNLMSVDAPRGSLDRFLGRWDFAEYHSIEVDAPPERVDAQVRDLDLGRSRVVRLLFRLRGMPARSARLDGMQGIGFQLLDDRPGEEIVLGLIGRFWTSDGGLCRFDAQDFVAFDEPGWAKAVWNFRMTPLNGGRTRLETETRVLCTDARSRRRFRVYWTFIRPFSGLIRRVALREVKNKAEATKEGVAGTRER